MTTTAVPISAGQPEERPMDKLITVEAVATTEAGALAAARLMGRGDRTGADRAAVEAMRRAMDEADISGTIVIGEGERDQAPMLYIGERVGNPEAALRVDIAVDPLEGTNLVATGSGNASAVLAAAEEGGLMHAPDTYMEKLIVGPQVAGHVSIIDPVERTIRTIADSLGRSPSDIVVVILDRPRHQELIRQVREAGARIKLISDGDLTAGISVAVSGTGVHAVMGIGGAPEGVLSAAALKCLGGEIQARFRWRSDEEKERARGMGIAVDDTGRVYGTNDLAPGENVVFCATGVTDGELLRGVRFFGGGARTHSLLMAYRRGLVRFIDTVHVFDIGSPPRVRL
jgi:fructose-1,6-bisphosphatase II